MYACFCRMHGNETKCLRHLVSPSHLSDCPHNRLCPLANDNDDAIERPASRPIPGLRTTMSCTKISHLGGPNQALVRTRRWWLRLQAVLQARPWPGPTPVRFSQRLLACWETHGMQRSASNTFHSPALQRLFARDLLGHAPLPPSSQSCARRLVALDRLRVDRQ